MSLKLHERFFIVQKASLDFSTMAIEFCRKHPDLTYVELFCIINTYTAQQLKYAIRQERHPNDPEKRGDEA